MAHATTLVQDRLTAGLFLAGAAIGLVGNGLHPHTADTDPASAIDAIAGSAPWVAIHLAIIVAILLLVGGLVGLTGLLRNEPGRRLSELGLAAAVVGGAIVVTSLAIDGFAMKALANAWVTGPDAGAGQALAVAATVKTADLGIWSAGMLVFFGLAFICYGAAIAAGGPVPRWLGWLALAGGAGSVVASILQLAAGGEVQVAETLFLGSSMLLTLWAFAVGLVTWQGMPSARVT
jgi:hypothetical protein